MVRVFVSHQHPNFHVHNNVLIQMTRTNETMMICNVTAGISFMWVIRNRAFESNHSFKRLCQMQGIKTVFMISRFGSISVYFHYGHHHNDNQNFSITPRWSMKGFLHTNVSWSFYSKSTFEDRINLMQNQKSHTEIIKSEKNISQGHRV